MGKYPAHTNKRRISWWETLFRLQLISRQVSALGLTHAAEKAARFQLKPWLWAQKVRHYACKPKEISNKIFLPRKYWEKNTREAGNRNHLRSSASLPILEKMLSPSLTKSPRVYQEQSSPNMNAELLGTSHSFWLMPVFSISLLSLMLSPRIH